MPEPFVWAIVTTLVARFRISSLAAGTAAPCGSVTVPLMMALVSCPRSSVPWALNVTTAAMTICCNFISMTP